MFSNTNIIHYQRIREIYREQFEPKTPVDKIELFSGCFKRQYYSYQMRMKKPDPNAFLKILSDFGIKPDEALFIDDNPKHLEGARAAGLYTYHYKKGIKFEAIRARIYEIEEAKFQEAKQEERVVVRARL